MFGSNKNKKLKNRFDATDVSKKGKRRLVTLKPVNNLAGDEKVVVLVEAQTVEEAIQKAHKRFYKMLKGK